MQTRSTAWAMPVSTWPYALYALILYVRREDWRPASPTRPANPQGLPRYCIPYDPFTPLFRFEPVGPLGALVEDDGVPLLLVVLCLLFFFLVGVSVLLPTSPALVAGLEALDVVPFDGGLVLVGMSG